MIYREVQTIQIQISLRQKSGSEDNGREVWYQCRSHIILSSSANHLRTVRLKNMHLTLCS